MAYQTLALQRRPPVAILSLCRPATGNRVDLLLLSELHQAIEELAGQPDTRVVVLTGADGVFSVGWDAGAIEEIRAEGATALRAGLLGSTFQFLVDTPLPVIAAVTGDALSAGFELALACDLRVVSETARLGLPETANGLLPMAGGTQRLARLAGRALALQMILTGEPIDATTALRHGLASAVVAPDRVRDTAEALAQTIARRGPLAVSLGKEAVHRGADMPLDQALRFETDLTVLLQTTDDRAEGVRAFVERRQPRFEGR